MATEETSKSMRNTKNDGFVCDICSETFASKRTLNSHNRKTHSETNVICDICRTYLASDVVLMVHKQIHHWEKEEMENKYYKPIHECPVCDLKTRSPGGLVLHCFEAHPSLELFTPTPKRKLKPKFRYDENQNKIPAKHADTEKDLGLRVKCPLCDVFYGENQIKGHFMTAHPHQKRLFCSHCAAIIVDEERMWDHLLEHSLGNDLHKCEFCDRLFISAQALATHNRLHTSQSPFSCSVCQKEFVSKTGAIAHFYSHLKIEILRETTPQKPVTSLAMPQIETNVAVLPADNGMITQKMEKCCCIMMEDSEEFVNVWD